MSTTSESATADQLSPAARRALMVLFLTPFLDLVGFSIIFPLFPQMLVYYRAVEGDAGVFGALYSALVEVTRWIDAPEGEWGVVVLFGGVLTALYSLLQFLFAPVLGYLSDRLGRRPAILFSLVGMFVAYGMWFVASGFMLLVAARVIGGMMSGNIGTATAVVADLTTPATRGRGMAVIGMAFGLGFIVGPMIGGLTALIDLTEIWPALTAYGVNPFSGPALVAALLTLVNLVQAYFRLDESLPDGERGTQKLRFFRGVGQALIGDGGTTEVQRTNWAYFLFVFAFSGMEFSLTFLAVDRLGFTPQGNAAMFLFIGTNMALVHGVYVRRFADKIGPRAMTLQGILCVAPGLVLTALAGVAQSIALLYLGLFLLAIGTAQAMACFTALASLYAPVAEQGHYLGMFRAVGALARAGGPLFGCVAYWRLGAPLAYVLGAALLILPLLLTRSLPPERKPQANAEAPA